MGLSGNIQGSLKYFDLKKGKLVIRRIAKQIPWPDRILKVANTWDRKSKKLILKNTIQFLNRKGKKFNWDNNKLSDLEVKEDQLKMIHPNIPVELPGIELGINWTALLRLIVRNKSAAAEQASAARIYAGLDAPPGYGAGARGVDDAPDANGNGDADQGVLPDAEGVMNPRYSVPHREQSTVGLLGRQIV